MRKRERDAFARGLELLRASATDPGLAVRHSGDVLALMSAVAPNVIGTPIPTRLVVPVTNPTVVHSTGVQAATAWTNVEFPHNGRVVGIVATVGEGAEHRTKIGMSLRIEGVAAIFTSGRSEAYCPLALFSDGSDIYGHHFMSFEREVDRAERWQVSFQAMYALGSGGPNNYNPSVAFLFESDED